MCMSLVALGRSLTIVSYVAFKMAALWFWTMFNCNPPIAHCHPLLWGGGILVDHWSTISSFILIKISLKFVPKGPIDNKKSIDLDNGLAALSEPVLTRFTDAYMEHYRKLNNRDVTHHWYRGMRCVMTRHDDVIKWKHFPRYWPFVWGIHWSTVNSPHKGQWRGALMFSLMCARINSWVNNREAGDLRRYRRHYDVIVMDLEMTLSSHARICGFLLENQLTYLVAKLCTNTPSRDC